MPGLPRGVVRGALRFRTWIDSCPALRLTDRVSGLMKVYPDACRAEMTVDIGTPESLAFRFGASGGFFCRLCL